MRNFSDRMSLLELGARFALRLLSRGIEGGSADACNLYVLLAEGLGSHDESPQVPLEEIVALVRGQVGPGVVPEPGLGAPSPADSVAVLLDRARALQEGVEGLAVAVFLADVLPLLEDVGRVLEGALPGEGVGQLVSRLRAEGCAARNELREARLRAEVMKKSPDVAAAMGKAGWRPIAEAPQEDAAVILGWPSHYGDAREMVRFGGFVLRGNEGGWQTPTHFKLIQRTSVELRLVDAFEKASREAAGLRAVVERGWRPVSEAPAEGFFLGLYVGEGLVEYHQVRRNADVPSKFRDARGDEVGEPSFFMPLPPPPAAKTEAHPSHVLGWADRAVGRACKRCGAGVAGGPDLAAPCDKEEMEVSVARALGAEPGEAGDEEARAASGWSRRCVFEDRAHVWARLRAWCEWWEKVDPELGAPWAYQSVLIVGGAEAVPWVSERISSAPRGIAYGVLDAPLEWALEGLGQRQPLDESISAPLYALVAARLQAEREARDAGDEGTADFISRAVWALGALAGEAEVPGAALVLGWAMGSRRHFDHSAGIYGAMALVERWHGVAIAALAASYRGPVRDFARVVCGWDRDGRGKNLDQNRAERKELDAMFREVDGAHLEGRFGDVDERLRNADPEAMGTTLSVGLLAITFMAADKLAERANFARRVRAYLERVDPERVDSLLRGLEV